MSDDSIDDAEFKKKSVIDDKVNFFKDKEEKLRREKGLEETSFERAENTSQSAF
jgi:hypothetical protein